MLKKLAIFSISLVFVLVAAVVMYPGNAQAQCSSSKTGSTMSDACNTQCKTACSDVSKSSCCSSGSNAVKSMSTTIPYRESKRVVIEGEYVCGKCTLQKLDTCQGFIKTSDGSLYPLLKSGKLRGMCKSAQANTDATYEIVGQVKRIDGIKYIEINKIAHM